MAKGKKQREEAKRLNKIKKKKKKTGAVVWSGTSTRRSTTGGNAIPSKHIPNQKSVTLRALVKSRQPGWQLAQDELDKRHRIAQQHKHRQRANQQLSA